MKDHKGYEYRPMDWQDKLVLLVCIVVVVILTVILGELV